MGVEMAKGKVSLLAVLVTAMSVIAIGGASARSMGPPTGLTSYGRSVWNLEALLQDTFGAHSVYLNVRRSWPKTPANFSVVFINNAHSAAYLFTFANAHRSAFVTRRPAKPPRPFIGASGGEVPLTVNGDYIDCGAGRWLFEHYGNGPANWQISCHR
jgi:hypothetical protein